MSEVVTSLADPAANIIFGAVVDDQHDGYISVTIVATGFSQSYECVRQLARQGAHAVASRSRAPARTERVCVCILHQRNGPPPASCRKDQQRGRLGTSPGQSVTRLQAASGGTAKLRRRVCLLRARARLWLRSPARTAPAPAPPGRRDQLFGKPARAVTASKAGDAVSGVEYRCRRRRPARLTAGLDPLALLCGWAVRVRAYAGGPCAGGPGCGGAPAAAAAAAGRVAAGAVPRAAVEPAQPRRPWLPGPQHPLEGGRRAAWSRVDRGFLGRGIF